MGRPPKAAAPFGRRLCVLCFCSFILLYYEYLWIFFIDSSYIPHIYRYIYIYIYVLNILHIFSFVCFVIYSVNRFKSNLLIGGSEKTERLENPLLEEVRPTHPGHCDGCSTCVNSFCGLSRMGLDR